VVVTTSFGTAVIDLRSAQARPHRVRSAFASALPHVDDYRFEQPRRSRGPWRRSQPAVLGAAIAVAEFGPMPGTVIGLRDTSSARARRAISLSRSAILLLRAGEEV